jgi:hypothetical protein
MLNNKKFRLKLGITALAVGIALTLGSHLLGSWELMGYDGNWHSITSDRLSYDIQCYDAHPNQPEVGRIVFYCGFGLSIQDYFPLAIPLLRSGYAVRIVAHSGSQNSGVTMFYKSHSVESMEATLPFLTARPDLPHFLMGHSEGTRYAARLGRDIPTIDGVVLVSSISASINTERPPNVLILVAENDFDNVARQSTMALIVGTNMRNPEFHKTYGEFAVGTARRKEVIPGTDHFSIFLSDASHRSILGWLGSVSPHPEQQISASHTAISRLAGIAVLVGAAIAAIGVGLLFSSTRRDQDGKGFPAWAVLLTYIVSWGVAPLLSNSVPLAREIPLLAYGRALAISAIATIPLLLLVLARPRLGIGIPRGAWKARAALLGVTLTLLLFDRWQIAVIPTGERLFWFALALLVTGSYFACDEFLRRGAQRATDWQTGLFLGLAGSLIIVISIAGGAFMVRSPVGEFLIDQSPALFILLAVCEVPATFLFTLTGDWLLSWWVRVSILNGYLASIVPLVSETGFTKMLP